MNLRFTVAMKSALFAIVVSHAAGVWAGQAPAVKQPPVESPKRILFVGNSYLYYNDSLHNHVRRLAIAADPAMEKALQYKSATIGGAPLAHHDVKGLLVPGRLGIKQPFDVVILQGSSGAALSEARSASFREKVIEFNAEIVKTGAKTALYMTHAYVKPNKDASPDMIRKIEDLYVTTGDEVGAYVIPVGLAFEEAYRQRPDIQLHKSYDGSHPDLIGTYLAACVVYASLYGKSPVGNPYDYYGKVDKETAAFLQRVADETVRRFYGWS
ncbi:MAG: SGNH/GDSL hydrolase family protein [Burkholderiales bacterium]|nr:SGNH/GDSL hydrolase family protein [Burkholderiales bacterium]